MYICRGVLATPTAAHRSSVLGIQVCAVVFDYNQGILCFWYVAHSRAGSHYAKCSAFHHPSWYIAKVCPTTQAGVSKHNRRLNTQRRWWEPTVDCQHVGHDVGNETANTKWGGLRLFLALSLYHYPSLTLCVWPSWVVVLFLQLFLVLVFKTRTRKTTQHLEYALVVLQWLHNTCWQPMQRRPIGAQAW